MEKEIKKFTVSWGRNDRNYSVCSHDGYYPYFVKNEDENRFLFYLMDGYEPTDNSHLRCMVMAYYSGINNGESKIKSEFRSLIGA